MLPRGNGSLMPLIQTLLYPDASLYSRIKPQIKDPWALAILNPETNSKEKTRFVMQWLKNKLSEKSDKGCDKNKDMAVHAAIHTAFQQLKEHQVTVWKLMIEALFGKAAVDGGFLDDTYYEIQFLKKATLEFTADYRFILHFEPFLTTVTYNTHYKLAKENVLAKELIHTCGLMSLTFAPNQDFHSGKAYFSEDSTRELMRRGLHWSEKFAQLLMRKSHPLYAIGRIFKNTGLSADMITEILKKNEPTALDEDIKSVVKPQR